MKRYLKNAILLFLFHPVSYLAGSLIASIPGLVIAAIFEHTRAVGHWVQFVLFLVLPLLFLFFFIQREAYETRRFAPFFLIASCIPTFLLQSALVLKQNYGAVIVGSVAVITEGLFPEEPQHIHYILTFIGLWLLVYIPVYLLAAYCGYKRRKNEINQMIQEHEESQS